MKKLAVNGKARGEFNFIVTKCDGKKEEYKFHNLLLNGAFSQSSRTLNYCTVGTGTNPPTPTDTGLQSRLGSNLSNLGIGSDVPIVWVDSVATVGRKTTFSFNPGEIVGNISELAIYASTSISPSNILIRALIEDINGNPTAITLGSGDQLTIEHTLYVEIETRPTPVVMNINSVSYTVSLIVAYPALYIYSPTDPTIISAQNYPELAAASGSATIAQGITVPSVGIIARPDYSGARVNKNPTAEYNLQPALGYSEITLSVTMDTGEQLPGNVAIGGMMVGGSISRPTIAVLFDPPLPKNSSVGYKFDITARISRS
ncbi:hypothetical protein PQI64_11310 [Shewanella bicestrii]